MIAARIPGTSGRPPTIGSCWERARRSSSRAMCFISCLSCRPDRSLAPGRLGQGTIRAARARSEVVAPLNGTTLARKRVRSRLLQIPDICILLRIADQPHRSYDADVPNKTIYVSDGDLPIYQRAQELAGGNLSAAIAAALRRYVDVEEGRREGFDEIIVRVGPEPAARSASPASSSASGSTPSSEPLETFRVYRSRTGKFVLHVERSPDWTMVDAEGKPAGWRGYLGIGNVSYGTRPAESTLEVVESLEELREQDPAAALRHGRRLGPAAGRRRPRHLMRVAPSPPCACRSTGGARDRHGQPCATPLAIRATGLRKSYGEQVVLDGIDLEVAEGTVYALLGPERRRQDDDGPHPVDADRRRRRRGRGRGPRRRARARRRPRRDRRHRPVLGRRRVPHAARRTCA